MTTLLTTEKLRTIVPILPQSKADEYLPHLIIAMIEFDIDTPLRQAGFIAQIAHETGGFKWFKELWGPTDDQKEYEPPHKKAKRLGNTEPGDGYRYRGRGVIHLTGRRNYRQAGKALNLPLEAKPDRAADPDVAFRIAGYYWQSRSINEHADKRDLIEMTKAVNGGLNGFGDRKKYYEQALDVLLPKREGK